MICRLESLAQIIEHVRHGGTIRVIDPDRGRGKYAGEIVDGYIYRPLRTWTDLAERLDLRLRTPHAIDGLLELVFEPLDRSTTVARDYEPGSEFSRISKLEDPCFVIDFREALERVGEVASVLDLGVNTGDELAPIRALYPNARITGIDRSAAALAIARSRYPDAEFIEADLAKPLPVGRFDLVVAIATLQSAALDDRDLLRRIVQDHAGAVIFGVPNCRYLDGEQRFGARMVNFTQPELGLLVKDVAFYRKYLQQHDRKVYVTGKHTILVTGTRN